MTTLVEIVDLLSAFTNKQNEDTVRIAGFEKQLNESTDRQASRNLRGVVTVARTELNKYILDTQNDISNRIINFLFGLEQFKDHGLLPINYHDDIKWCYVTLSDLGRLTARYVKLPKSWIPLGYLAGVLEDLVVIMRTAKQLSISPNHLITLDELVNGFDAYTKTETEGPRFPFLTKLFTLSRDRIIILLKSAIDAQGKARRIAIYNDLDDGQTYYYAIQGLLGGVKFDSRVVQTLTPDSTPPFAVHFTNKEVALNIWNQTETTAKRNRPSGIPLVVGAICKFDRPIHALTNIEFVDGYYRIVTIDKDIKDRMTHGIKDVNVRPKYESGLVIDLKKLVANMEHGKVQMNELGTLLVHDDIPHEYLLACLHTDEDLNHFWHI
ncbi:hypothetical protein QKU48_gp1015 [Fadolivirus algeromassiliense]|jgi:hypothetical protein|uniref:Uncharacterized protein n=1 Tax=Fadolivirus FV1/VV64 TaxID=3070911 RepID=A0A7D3URA5_9VIRU|nr:hypothetical protein QKU48_gp1015 [Fadolivirus algeromassiliense]QKF94473.1 hypothetical protein Fadolivirus_1_1015 [Fadolivirus FV1/VV64]